MYELHPMGCTFVTVHKVDPCRRFEAKSCNFFGQFAQMPTFLDLAIFVPTAAATATQLQTDDFTLCAHGRGVNIRRYMYPIVVACPDCADSAILISRKPIASLLLQRYDEGDPPEAEYPKSGADISSNQEWVIGYKHICHNKTLNSRASVGVVLVSMGVVRKFCARFACLAFPLSQARITSDCTLAIVITIPFTYISSSLLH